MDELPKFTQQSSVPGVFCFHDGLSSSLVCSLKFRALRDPITVLSYVFLVPTVSLDRLLECYMTCVTASDESAAHWQVGVLSIAFSSKSLILI